MKERISERLPLPHYEGVLRTTRLAAQLIIAGLGLGLSTTAYAQSCENGVSASTCSTQNGSICSSYQVYQNSPITKGRVECDLDTFSPDETWVNAIYHPANNEFQVYGFDDPGQQFCCIISPPSTWMDLDILGGGGVDHIYLHDRPAGFELDTDGSIFVNGIANGGYGEDEIQGSDSTDPSYKDSLIGGAQDDEIRGYAGNDHLHGDGGDDVLRGGNGVDVLDGGDDEDDLDGEGGNDFVCGGYDGPGEGDTINESGGASNTLWQGGTTGSYAYGSISGTGADTCQDFSTGGTGSAPTSCALPWTNTKPSQCP